MEGGCGVAGWRASISSTRRPDRGRGDERRIPGGHVSFTGFATRPDRSGPPNAAPTVKRVAQELGGQEPHTI